MASDRHNRRDREGKSKQVRVAEQEAELVPRPASINIERSGNWMPAEEFQHAAQVALEAGGDVAVNLDKVDHLDGSALQILLALETELKNHGRRLQLENASPHLRQWFEFAGTADHSFRDGADKQ